MVQLTKTILIFGCLVPSVLGLRGTPQEQEKRIPTRRRRTKKGKGDKGSENGVGGGIGDDLTGRLPVADEVPSIMTEPHECLPFDDVPAHVMAATTGPCLNNDCPTGCCRVFAYLQCDADDELHQLPVSLEGFFFVSSHEKCQKH